MMFTIQIIISFFVGGILIALQTLIGERVSLRWRGIILTIPTTTAIGLFFIGIAKSPIDAANAALYIPASAGASYTFVTIFTLLRNKGLVLSYFFALIFWGLFASLIITFPPSTFTNSILIFLVIPVIIGYLTVKSLPQIPDLKKFPMNFRHLFFRSLLGGFIIALGVFLSKTLVNIWGGIFTTFPAVFSSSLIIYYYLQGAKVIPSVSKSMFFPGAVGFPLYVIVVNITFPIYGIWLGTLLAYLAYTAFLLFWDFMKKVLFS